MGCVVTQATGFVFLCGEKKGGDYLSPGFSLQCESLVLQASVKLGAWAPQSQGSDLGQPPPPTLPRVFPHIFLA